MINLYLLYKEEKYYKCFNIIDKINRIIIKFTIIKDKAFVLYKLKKYSSSINICKVF